TDDSCDLTREYLQEHDVEVIELSYIIDDVVYKAYDKTPKEFYQFLRDGKMPVTAQVNIEDARAFMEPFVKEGKDVLYIAFSSGLSGTCNSAMTAAADLREEYPGRDVMVVDSLAASMGQGFIIRKAIEQRDAGEPMAEIAKWVVDNRDKVVHMVAVEDLMHLHRGGRVSRMSAIAGSMLGIKPIIHLDVDGKLKVIDKVRGRKQALLDVIAKTEKRVGAVPNDFFMVSHADCLEDAQFVAEEVSKRTGIKDYMINYIGPVIGSHTGLGVIALFMLGDYK
ncbi:DegV family protein, partial [Ruminococcaceae bacterium OttesenSCG-928-L11]|nr:DegV family protein [Ruminococcaceae bacterium OttesenSCG-928-L11]